MQPPAESPAPSAPATPEAARRFAPKPPAAEQRAGRSAAARNRADAARVAHWLRLLGGRAARS